MYQIIINMSSICVNHERLMIGYIRDIDICTFLVNMHDVIYYFRIRLLAIFALLFFIFSGFFRLRSRFRLLLIVLAAVCRLNCRYNLFLWLRGRLTWPRGWDARRRGFHQGIWILTLSQCFGLDDLCRIILTGFVRIVIGLVCLHVYFISLPRSGGAASRTLLLLLDDLVVFCWIHHACGRRIVSNCLLACDLRLKGRYTR